jgi:glycosyltransferase involved in cell wall biosynthesis
LKEISKTLYCAFDVFPAPTGFSQRLSAYAKVLPTRYAATALTLKAADTSHVERLHGMKILRIPAGTGDLPSQMLTFERAVRRQLESEEYALVHFCDPIGGYALAEMKAQYGYSLIYEAIHFPSQELEMLHPHWEGNLRLRAKLRRQELFCLMNADMVLTGSLSSRKAIHALGTPLELIDALPPPIDLARFAGCPEPSRTPMRLLYVGSQAPWQGLKTLLLAAHRAQKAIDFQLTILGPRHPMWQPRLEGMAQELGLSPKVKFHPAVAHEELPRFLAEADVGLLTLSDSERGRFGGSLSKAALYLASGRPIIAADLPVCREVLPEGTTTFYQADNPDALASRIVQLSKSAQLRVEMGERGRTAASRFSETRVGQQLLSAYEWLLGPQTEARSPADEASHSSHTPTPKLAPYQEPTDKQLPPPPPRASPPIKKAPAAKAPQPSMAKAASADADLASTPQAEARFIPEAELASIPEVEATSTDEVKAPPIAEVEATPVPEAEAASISEMEDASIPEEEADLLQEATAPVPDAAPTSAEEPPPSATAHGSEATADGTDRWMAQVLQGYCPPEGVEFQRPTPPAGLPGKRTTGDVKP